GDRELHRRAGAPGAPGPLPVPARDAQGRAVVGGAGPRGREGGVDEAAASRDGAGDRLRGGLPDAHRARGRALGRGGPREHPSCRVRHRLRGRPRSGDLEVLARRGDGVGDRRGVQVRHLLPRRADRRAQLRRLPHPPDPRGASDRGAHHRQRRPSPRRNRRGGSGDARPGGHERALRGDGDADPIASPEPPRLEARVKRAAVLLLAAFARFATAQEPRSVGSELNVIRWREDYGFLRDKEQPTLVERLKFIPLNESKSAYLTVGGQIRERVEGYDPAFFGLPGGPTFTSYATRLLADADPHLGARFRTFAELGSYWEDGREPASRPIDVGDLELQQAFADFVALDRRVSRLTLRVGRQELPLGTGRLVSIRDGANVRLSFDAAKATWVRSGRIVLEASAGRPVVASKGLFESETSDREWFWYMDLSRAPAAAGRPSLELFYVGPSLTRPPHR